MLELTATGCAGIFAGAAVYTTIVQHPAAAALGTPAAVQFFRRMYDRAAPMQVSLALVGSLAALAAWWSGSGRLWLLGACLLSFSIPFTLLVILPTNRRLQDPTLDLSSAEAAELLARWGRRHAVRSIASMSSFVVFLTASAGC